MKCSKCKKQISFFTNKGYDINGNLLCGDCWGKLDDFEREVMLSIRSKEEYEDNKTELRNKLKSTKKGFQKSSELSEVESKEELSTSVALGILKAFAVIIILLVLFFMFFKIVFKIELIPLS
jgi:hypothetical protein